MRTLSQSWGVARACNPGTCENRIRRIWSSRLHRKFKCSLGYMRPCLNVKDTSKIIKGCTTCWLCSHCLILETLNILSTEVPCPASTLSTRWLFSPCARDSRSGMAGAHHSHETTETNTSFPHTPHHCLEGGPMFWTNPRALSNTYLSMNCHHNCEKENKKYQQNMTFNRLAQVSDRNIDLRSPRLYFNFSPNRYSFH